MSDLNLSVFLLFAIGLFTFACILIGIVFLYVLISIIDAIINVIKKMKRGKISNDHTKTVQSLKPLAGDFDGDVLNILYHESEIFGKGDHNSND